MQVNNPTIDSPVFTSLDTSSTSLHQTIPSSYRDFLLRTHETEFNHVYSAYFELNYSTQSKVLERLQNCRCRSSFAVNIQSRKVKVLSSSCNVRFCPLCDGGRRSLIYKNTLEYIENIKAPKMITLTLKATDEPLAEQIDFLYKSAKNFRRLKSIKKVLRGGIFFFQLTQNATTKLFHPHLHILCDCDYINQKKLSDEWRSVTGGSYIVDVRQVKNAKSAADYVSRYTTKPCLLSKFSLDDSQKIIMAFSGRRLCGTFGNAFKAKLTKKPEFKLSDWLKIGSWSVVANLINYDENAALIFDCWRNHKPLPDGVSLGLLDHVFGERPPSVNLILE